MNETAMLERDLATEVGVEVDRIFCNGLYPGALRRARDRADRGGAAGGAPAPRAAACRAALTESRRARAQREQLARLEENCEAPVTTLPYLFSAELGVEAIEALADRRGGLMASVAELLEGKRVCVCAGLGRGRQDDHLGGDRRRDGGARASRSRC